MIVPPYLKPGDTIGVVCPAGYMPFDKITRCLETLQQWGFQVKLGSTPGNRFHYFSGTDEERLNDLQNMLDDDAVHAILCARGGYGLSRIIDRINFNRFRQHPKWVIGYSDVTLLHTHLQAQLGIASLHAPMAAAFHEAAGESVYLQSVREALTGRKMQYPCNGCRLNREGVADGILTGGNLALLVHAIGTASEADTEGKLLFIEDVGEYIYNADRMMMQLQRAGKLAGLAGLIAGSFTEMKDTVMPFGESVYDVIYDKVQAYGYPVCFDFPVGHTDANYALQCGVPHRLAVGHDKVLLQQL